MKRLDALIFIPMLATGLSVFLYSCSGGEKGYSEENTPGSNEKIANVETCIVKKTGFEDVLHLTGTTEPFRTVTISSEETGKITHLNCEKGREININNVLARQDTDQLALQVKIAEANFALAETNYNRIKKLFDRGSTSNQEMQTATVNRDVASAQLELAKLHLDRASIKSPVNGIVTEKFVELGEMLSPGVPVCTIIDTHIIKIVTGVPEQELPFLENGLSVKLSFDIYPGRVFIGKVSYVGAAGNTRTGTFPLEIQHENGENLIKPGMITRISLIRRVLKDVIVIPQSAVLDREGTRYVFLVENDTARDVIIQVGPTNETFISVVKGLTEGDQLIMVGHRDLVQGEKVHVVKTHELNCEPMTGAN